MIFAGKVLLTFRPRARDRSSGRRSRTPGAAAGGMRPGGSSPLSISGPPSSLLTGTPYDEPCFSSGTRK